MTVHHPKRIAAVKVSAQPRSSAYERSKRGPLAVSAQQLREGVSNVSSRKDPGDVQQSFLQVRAPQWYLYTRALLERHFHYDEPIATCAADLGISNEEAESIITQAIHVGEHKIGLKFQFANSSNAKYPRSPKEPCVKLLAEEIALRLDKLARDNPAFLEEGVWTYISNVHKTNRLVLTAPAQAPNLRKWMALVRKLQGEDLSIRVIGFLVNGVKGNLDQPMKLLNLSRSTPIHWVNAHNQNSRAVLNHLGIDVVCRLERKGNLSISVPRPFATRWPLRPSHRFGGCTKLKSARQFPPRRGLNRLHRLRVFSRVFPSKTNLWIPRRSKAKFVVPAIRRCHLFPVQAPNQGATATLGRRYDLCSCTLSGTPTTGFAIF